MNNRQRDFSLDFLKIIATVFIVFHHYQQVTEVTFESGINFYGGKFYFGYMVELFFLLSGLFMYPYINKIRKGELSFPQFYFIRLSRLFPLMALGAITYEVFLSVYQIIYQDSWFGITTTFWGTIIASLGIQDGWALSNPCVNNPTWYISVLMLCYVVFFLIVYLSKRMKIIPQYVFVFMIFLGMGIQTYGINLPFFNESSARGYYAFFFGLLLAEGLKDKRIANKGKISFLIIIVLTILIIYYPSFMSIGLNYVMTFIYYPVVIILCRTELVRKIIDREIFGKIAQISFDVFIWHNPFYILLYILIKVFDWNLNLNSYLTMIGYTIVCYVFGTFSYYCIELPLKNVIDKKMRKKDNAV